MGGKLGPHKIKSNPIIIEIKILEVALMTEQLTYLQP
ncbi:hypothetical protein J2Z83_001442 [Virgibacillus natechei]|uniref:Uncharacterized protein n=1 Tax=Virgibacillus natechei TaxID=1216297 RepID=A0ABS4IER3_9BACI|nr:hypothetical protein [Virgibacillus natechei]